jgi:hypothetical protein
MATTTPNFGWSVPTSTDLVKDGATAIETLGDAIDASLLDLKGGTTGQVLSKNSNTDMDFTWVAADDTNAIQNALLTTTGDTIYASGASTPARLGIGTTGQVLTVSGGVPTWSTVSAGSMTQLATGTLSGSTTTLSSISGAYTNLVLVIYGFGSATAGYKLDLTLNNVESGYGFARYATQAGAGADSISGRIRVETVLNGTSQKNNAIYTIYNYANTTTFKQVTYYANHILNGGTDTRHWIGTYNRDTASAITSLEIKNDIGSFNAGTYILYGVK